MAPPKCSRPRGAAQRHNQPVCSAHFGRAPSAPPSRRAPRTESRETRRSCRYAPSTVFAALRRRTRLATCVLACWWEQARRAPAPPASPARLPVRLPCAARARIVEASPPRSARSRVRANKPRACPKQGFVCVSMRTRTQWTDIFPPPVTCAARMPQPSPPHSIRGVSLRLALEPRVFQQPTNRRVPPPSLPLEAFPSRLRLLPAAPFPFTNVIAIPVVRPCVHACTPARHAGVQHVQKRALKR